MPSARRTFFIANPTSGAGAVAREWDVMERHIKSTLSDYDVAHTTGPGHATLLAREALRAGWEMVVAVGGDGTLNEVVNGFFEECDPRACYQLQADGWISSLGIAPEPINPSAALGIIPLGTGGDFRRTVGLMGGWKEAVNALGTDNTRAIDTGRIAFIDPEGELQARYWINIASAGISGDVDHLVNTSSKRMGGTLTFATAALRAFAGWKNAEVEFRIDDLEEVHDKILFFATGNGQYFGGGMWVTPGASLSDGKLQLVVLSDLSKAQAMSTFAALYSGTHIGRDKVWRKECQRVSIRSIHRGRRVLLDVDGEQPGRLPALIEVHPHMLTLKS